MSATGWEVHDVNELPSEPGSPVARGNSGSPDGSERQSSPSNRDSSPSGSSYACSVPTLTGHTGRPEPSGPYLLAYEPNERSVRNCMRLDKFNAKSTEGHLNPNTNNAPTPVAFSRGPTPPAPLLPHGYYYLAPQPQRAQIRSASPQTYPTPRASSTPSARSSSYAADDELEAVSRRSTSHRGSASPYYASSTTLSGSASPSYSTSRASSASLTPEPEQHFQCPDCSAVFGSREVLNMHLGGLYHHGHCPAHH